MIDLKVIWGLGLQELLFSHTVYKRLLITEYLSTQVLSRRYEVGSNEILAQVLTWHHFLGHSRLVKHASVESSL